MHLFHVWNQCIKFLMHASYTVPIEIQFVELVKMILLRGLEMWNLCFLDFCTLALDYIFPVVIQQQVTIPT